MRLKLAFAFFALCLSATTAGAEEGETIKVQNGVTVKSGLPDYEKNKKKDSEEDSIEIPERPKAVSRPIINGKPVTLDRTKLTPAQDSPFKKLPPPEKEVMNKPVEKPEVKSRPLNDEEESEDEFVKVSGKPGESGLPIPRFVALKSGEVNARSGPGENYPIRWVYQRKFLPVEVTGEFKLWRRIKDFDGDQTWVHQALLIGKRYAIVSDDAEAASDYDDGHVVARFKKGVQVKVYECRKSQCYVEYGSIEGWLDKDNLWGVYEDESFD